ncbi:hypothetical protein BU14_0448s0003 [Porphyra umbilicalis]|uniref:Uncharacterized protein n=1 Tax=Porphyra umbilicalis TaxID=2786 RepID=A0A1X6NUR6_PORUM|nr:hypothetical protein BU14_0448s0003 [Porphyra umbilicalis]|eukprot:OSX72305.1 hypothetical protein BU14_0448s0003 [Porphyra umbilicalis]
MLAAAVAAACLPAMAAAAATPPPRLSTSGTRTRLSFQTGLNHVSDIDFRLLFRVTRDDFQTLHAAVARRLAVEEGMAVLSSGACIPTECRLAFCLRMLASASYLDCFFFVLSALDSEPFLQNIKFPSSPSELATQSDLFSRGGRSLLRGCVSAIDGIALRICRPQADAYKSI